MESNIIGVGARTSGSHSGKPVRANHHARRDAHFKESRSSSRAAGLTERKAMDTKEWWSAIGLSLDAVGSGWLLVGLLRISKGRVAEMAQSYMLGSDDPEVLLHRPIGLGLLVDRRRARIAVPLLLMGFLCQLVGVFVG